MRFLIELSCASLLGLGWLYRNARTALAVERLNHMMMAASRDFWRERCLFYEPDYPFMSPPPVEPPTRSQVSIEKEGPLGAWEGR